MTEQWLERICNKCIDDTFLMEEMVLHGSLGRCDNCNREGHTVEMAWLTEKVKVALEEHYYHTPTEPDTEPSEYIKEFGWERSGEPIVTVISELLGIDADSIAVQIRQELEARFGSGRAAEIGEEDRFAEEAHYARKRPDDSEYLNSWSQLEHTLKTEARFFNSRAAEVLAAVFGDFETFRSRFGFPIVQDAGPTNVFHNVFRGRVINPAQIEAVLANPERELGPPPSSVASAGRMNPHGVSVFYGASSPETVLAEVRPPVGAHVAIARFAFICHIRLLDIRGFSNIHVEGSKFDPEYGRRLRQVSFLRRLSSRLTKPVLPHETESEYLVTQVVAEYLAQFVDGLIFSSTQTADGGCNVVLFRTSAHVQSRQLPEGTVVEVNCVTQTDDGLEPDYWVTERVPDNTEQQEPDESAQNNGATLRLELNTLQIHHVRAVSYVTESHHVGRHRQSQAQEREF